MPKRTNEAFDGHRLKRLRETLRLSQSELASILSIEPSTISYWERKGRPMKKAIADLCEFFEVPQDYFSREEEPPFPANLTYIRTKLPDDIREKVELRLEASPDPVLIKEMKEVPSTPRPPETSSIKEEAKPKGIPHLTAKPPEPPSFQKKLEAVSRVLGVTIEELMEIEQYTKGAEKALAYSRYINTQLNNIREFQNVIDLYLGRVNDRLLELEELKTRAKNLASAIKGDDKNIEFDLLPVRIAGR